MAHFPHHLPSTAALLIVAAIGSFVGARTLWLPELGVTAGNLTVPREALSLGEVWATNNFQLTLPITNQTSSEVVVDGFETSCNCVSSIAPAQFRLGARATREVHFTIDLNRNRPRVTEGPLRPFALEIAPSIQSTGRRRMAWRIHGDVRDVLSCSPEVVNFADLLVRGVPVKRRTVEITAMAPVRNVRAECASGRVSLKFERVDRSNKYKLSVRPNQELGAASQFVATILIHSDSPDGRKLPPVHLPVIGRVVDDMECVPPHLLFRWTSESISTAQVVVVTSRSGRPLNNVEAIPASKAISVTRLPTFDETAWRFEITLASRAAARLHEVVAFRGNTSDGKVVQTSLSVLQALSKPSPSSHEVVNPTKP